MVLTHSSEYFLSLSLPNIYIVSKIKLEKLGIDLIIFVRRSKG